jgi:MFS transporter, putative metabolite:H+ symporter
MTIPQGAPAFAAAARLTVAQRMDRLPVTRLHLAILALATLGLFTDIAEVALSNALAAVFLAPPYKVPSWELSLLLASVFAGGAIGAPVFGWLADRHGRRIALQAALALIVASSIAAAASPGIWWMTAFRFISGLAIGGYPPLTGTYLSDVLPPRRRGTLIYVCAALAFLGAPGMILLFRALAPVAPFGIEAWRWSLALGGLVAAVAGALFALVPESPRWLAAVARHAEADRACRRFEVAAGITPPPVSDADVAMPSSDKGSFGALVAYPLHRKRALLISALFTLGPWATIGFPLLSAAVLVHKGFNVRDSLLFASISMFGPTLGNLGIAPFVDPFERRIVIVGCAGAMIVVGIVFASATGLAPLIAAGVLFNLASAVYSAALAIYAAELFPTGLRATATAGAWGLGRAVSAVVPLTLLPLLKSYGTPAMFAIIAGALAVSMALVLKAGPPGLARQPLP